MKTKDRDIQSYIVIVDSFIDQAALHPQQADLIKKELKKYITVRFSKNKWVHPEITKFCTDWYREFYRMVNGQDPYKDLKIKSNEKALELLPTLSVSSLRDAIAACIIGNKIDYGACLVGKYDLEHLQHDLASIPHLPLHIDETAILQQKLQSAKNVLYLVDNNGEVIFDILLLQEIAKIVGKENLFIMGKETPMLNDVTVADLHSLGFEKYGTIVSTGSNCFGLHTEDISLSCKKYLQDADLIIAKGQAYLEFFTEYNFSNVINILTVKYPIVNPAFGILPSGYNAVLSSERYAHFGKNYFAQGM